MSENSTPLKLRFVVGVELHSHCMRNTPIFLNPPDYQLYLNLFIYFAYLTTANQFLALLEVK